MAEAWARGEVVDWPLFYGEDRPPRLHLPTYPFARERYEAAENLAAEAEARSIARLTAESGDETMAGKDALFWEEAIEPFELMTFEEVWEEQAPAQTHVRPRTLICFLSDPDQQRVIRELVSRKVPGSRLIFIAQHGGARDSDQHVPSDALVFHVNPLDKASYSRIFQCLQQEGVHVDAVLYLWADEDETLVQNLAPMVYILQAMAETTLSIERILCAARCHIDSLDRCFLEAWIGFERSLGLVWPHTPVIVVLDENGGPGVSAWLERLWFELSTSTPQSILYRNGQRHVCRIQPTVLDQDNGAALRMGGTYLITGGCGRLGLMLARHLAETRAANLILTGRSTLDAAKHAAIEQLEGAGSKVLYIQADVCDAAAMTVELRRARQHFGAIHGVIHAAGVQSGGSVFGKSIADFQQVLDPKIAGTLVLDQVLGDDHLDFICYFSSSAAILGRLWRL